MKFYEIIVAAAYVLSYDMPEFFSCKNLTYNVNIYVFLMNCHLCSNFVLKIAII